MNPLLLLWLLLDDDKTVTFVRCSWDRSGSIAKPIPPSKYDAVSWLINKLPTDVITLLRSNSFLRNLRNGETLYINSSDQKRAEEFLKARGYTIVLEDYQ